MSLSAEVFDLFSIVSSFQRTWIDLPAFSFPYIFFVNNSLSPYFPSLWSSQKTSWQIESRAIAILSNQYHLTALLSVELQNATRFTKHWTNCKTAKSDSGNFTTPYMTSTHEKQFWAIMPDLVKQLGIFKFNLYLQDLLHLIGNIMYCLSCFGDFIE